jgi:hypothetical protein
MNFGQVNLFDCDRQRSYFERTNQRLQKKISLDIKRETTEEIRRIQVRCLFIFLNQNQKFLFRNK